MASTPTIEHIQKLTEVLAREKRAVVFDRCPYKIVNVVEVYRRSDPRAIAIVVPLAGKNLPPKNTHVHC